MPTLVLPPRYSPDSNALWSAAVQSGWAIERLQSFRIPAGLDQRDPVFYGETLLADAVAEPLGLSLLEPTPDWLPRLPARWRGRDIRLMTFGEAKSLQEPAFVKAVDEKWIPARVYPSGDHLAATAGDGVGDDLLVLVQGIVRFEFEFRTFVLERRIASQSPYIIAGDVAERDGVWTAPEEEVSAARAFAEAFLSDASVELPPAVVIDVGRLATGEWAVVEANAAWASGICGCEPKELLPVLRRASVPRGELSTSDARWARDRHTITSADS